MPSSAKFRVLNNALSNKKLKIKKTSLDDGLKYTINWYKKKIIFFLIFNYKQVFDFSFL